MLHICNVIVTAKEFSLEILVFFKYSSYLDFPIFSPNALWNNPESSQAPRVMLGCHVFNLEQPLTFTICMFYDLGFLVVFSRGVLRWVCVACLGFLSLRWAGATLCCGAQASSVSHFCCRAQALECGSVVMMRGLVTPQQVESSRTRDQTHVLFIDRQFHIYCTTKEVQHWHFLRVRVSCPLECPILLTNVFPHGQIKVNKHSVVRNNNRWFCVFSYIYSLFHYWAKFEYLVV